MALRTPAAGAAVLRAIPICAVRDIEIEKAGSIAPPCKILWSGKYEVDPTLIAE
jgi:hypothetical protein